MTIFLLFILLLLVVIGWLKLRDQMNAVDARFRWSSKQDRTTLEGQIAELAARVLKLERQLGVASGDSESVAPQPEAAFVQPRTSQTLQPELTTIAEAPQTSAQPAAIGPEAVPPQLRVDSMPAFSRPVLEPAQPRPSWSDRLRRLVGDSEWEMIVAGSVMNKIGALVLVIGIALFLGYSVKRVNPAGRAATAALTSAVLLAGGVVLERRQRYRVFSRGLIGAGWAALYTTAYAMYALPAAQVISSAFAGSLLLLAVAAGMIAHSLRYRTQAVTAVAYFAAFAALAATPSTPFAVASLIPLAVSLLYFAWRFEWHAMALFGLFSTWATCISRGNSNAPLYATTSLFIIYWLLFEAFDVLRSRRGLQEVGLTWIFPVNAMAFLGLTYQAWFTHASHEMWRMAALSALLFFGSALLRIRFNRAAGEAAATDPFDCIRNGTYQAPLTVAAVLAALAILGRVTGFWTNVALAFEAEIFYLAGIRFQSGFLRALGCSGFTASLLDIGATAWSKSGTVSIFGVSLQTWTPSVIVHVFLFYLNRAVSRAATVFSFAATGLLALVITSEFTPHVAPLTLFVLALALFEIALRKRFPDLRIQSYLVAFTAMLWVLWTGGFAPHAPASVWACTGLSALACWLFTGRVFFVSHNELGAEEINRVRDLFAIAGSGFALLTSWILLPGPATAIAWTCLASAWLGIASLLNLNAFRWLAAAILGFAFVRLLGVNLSEVWPEQGVAQRLITPVFVIGALYYIWHVFRRVAEERVQSFAPVFTWLAAVAALRLLYLEVNRFYIASAWATLGVFLLISGVRMSVSAFRWQSYCVAGLAALCCMGINFTQSDSTDLFARIFGGLLLIAILFAAEFLFPRNVETFGPRERYARPFFSVLAVLLLTALLYHEVSGGLLTVAWGLEALACLGSGFPARERVLRLLGLAVFALCILKLFLYDLRNLETVYRILSFIALGLILLCVSWIYTRFRVEIRRYL